MESGIALYSVLKYAFIVSKHRQGCDTDDFPDADGSGQGRRPRRDRKLGNQLVVIVDKKESLFGIDVDFPVSERGVWLCEAFMQVLDFERQYVWHFDSVAGFEGIKIHSRVELADVCLGGMESFCYKIEQRSVFQRLQLRLLGRFGRRRSYEILCFRRNRISGERLRHLIQ